MQATLTLLLCLCCAALTHCQRRRIDNLPRLNFQTSFTQYSGYLTSTDGRRLFYWLVESSEVTPAEAPLVLWLNGGPGCSSVGGLLMTNGPFLANDRAELDRNDLAWNRLANLLYIDSPSGVGLSEPGPVDRSVLNEKFTTELNLGALLDFYRLFPEYRRRPFYIAGESYAGIYIPWLAHAIQSSSHFPDLINLKGIAVGNGLHVPTDDPDIDMSRAKFRDVMGISLGGVSVVEVKHNNETMSINHYNIAKPCYRQDPTDSYSCVNSTGLVAYLNDEAVLRALGTKSNRISGRYKICSHDIRRHYTTAKMDIIPEIESLLGSKVSVLLYHGTLDYLLPANVTQQKLKLLIDNTKLPLRLDREGAWYYCYRESGRASVQIGGLERSYQGGLLTYRTVVGAGHSVPTDRPDMGFQIFADFLRQSDSSQRQRQKQQLDCQSRGAASGFRAALVPAYALLAAFTVWLLVL